jgi:hypothetical protein
VQKIKAETLKKCFARAGFGESDMANNLEQPENRIFQQKFVHLNRPFFASVK